MNSLQLILFQVIPKSPLTYAQTYSIKFGSTVFYITYNDVLNGIPATMPVFQVTAQTLINNSTQSFGAHQGEKTQFPRASNGGGQRKFQPNDSICPSLLSSILSQ